ncbi:MAG: hypothetical protein ACM3TR_01055 [Caulobacteraceae bacterium]
MKSKKINMHENRIECFLNCRYYRKCIIRNGKKCKHLGGKCIPKFKEPIDAQIILPDAP